MTSHKNNPQHQKNFRENAKENGKRQLSVFISAMAFQAVSDLAAEKNKTKAEIIESLVLTKE